MSSDDRSSNTEEQERVVIRDNRKIDPQTGAARTPAGADTAPAGPADEPHGGPSTEGEQVPMVEAALLDERTADLQRLQAEYANYRRRAERDRQLAGDLAVGKALAEFLPVLDDLDRAAAHGDLTGGLKSVADTLVGTVTKLGLEGFGEVGDPFDPELHEAVAHDESEDVTVPTCTTVMRRGYRMKDRLLRPAMVAVTAPSSAGSATDPEAEPSAPDDPSDTPASPPENGSEQGG